jgi:KaiC/GvpD/RAD55 family RecA-like ATPase
MIERLESLILHSLMTDPKIWETVLPHIQPFYFSDPAERSICAAIIAHTAEYKTIPDPQSVLIAINNATPSQEVYEEAVEYVQAIAKEPVSATPWMLTKCERWIKDCRIYLAKCDLVADKPQRTIAKITEDLLAAEAFTLQPVKVDVISYIRTQSPQTLPRQEISYLIEPEIPKGALVMITGKPGSGKSTLVLTWCRQMALAGCDILYLDRDNGISIIQDRIIERFGNSFPSSIAYWGLWVKDDKGQPLEPPFPDSKVIKEWIKTAKNPVIVFDTFASFSTADENDNAAIGVVFKTFRGLANLGATVLIIHHTTKDGQSDYRGASVQEGAVDAGLRVVSDIVEGRIQTITVHTFKTRLGDGKPIFYKMDDNGIPVRQTKRFEDILFDLLQQNPGLTKEKFEDLARRTANIRQKTTREFITNNLVAGKIKYEKRALSVKEPEPKTGKRKLSAVPLVNPAEPQANLDEVIDDELQTV